MWLSVSFVIIIYVLINIEIVLNYYYFISLVTIILGIFLVFIIRRVNIIFFSHSYEVTDH